jgi:hypothetical protein
MNRGLLSNLKEVVVVEVLKVLEVLDVLGGIKLISSTQSNLKR